MKSKGLKVSLFFAVALLLSVSALFAGGSEDAGAAEDKVYEFTVSGHSPAVMPAAKALADWAAWIQEQSDGRVIMNVHLGGSLMKGTEAYRGVQEGIADAAQYVLDGREGFLLNQVVGLPFMGWPSQMDCTEIYEKLLAEYPEMMGEWRGVKPMVAVMMPGTHIHTATKPVKTPEDLRGLKIQTSEAMPGATITALGGTPVAIKVEDMYLSFERGLVDGVLNHFFALDAWGVLEIAEYHTIFGEGGIGMLPMTVIMNEEKFNSLPSDLQKIFVDAKQVWVDSYIKYDLEEQQPKVMNGIKEMNHTMINLTDAQIAEWRDMVKDTVHQQWIDECEAKGLPGQAVYDESLELIAEYK